MRIEIIPKKKGYIFEVNIWIQGIHINTEIMDKSGLKEFKSGLEQSVLRINKVIEDK